MVYPESRPDQKLVDCRTFQQEGYWRNLDNNLNAY